MAEKAQITITSTTLSVPLWVDRDRIIQTLTNLLSNAIKFSDPNTTVNLEVDLQGDKMVVFQVKDRGRGIPPDHLESIFDRFQQVDASDSRDRGGTGLGLAISRSIVQQHDGQIWVESTLGQGSTFYVTLPISNNKS
jgi:signal transduction histidine kinase